MSENITPMPDPSNDGPNSPDDPFGDAMWAGINAAPAPSPQDDSRAPAPSPQDAQDAQQRPPWVAGVIVPPAAAQAAQDDSQAPAAATRPPWVRSFQDMLAQQPPQWLIAGWLAPGDIGMLYGTPGTGKTFVALDIAISAVLGKAAGGGQWAIPRPLRVAYATSEGLSGLGGRLRAIGQRRGLLGMELPGLAICAQLPQLFSAGDDGAVAWATAVQAAAVQPDIVILDTLHGATAGADENSARDMGVVLGSVRYIRDALGCAVLLVHHANKAGGYRGSSALHGAVDLMARCESDDGLRLSCEKLKDGAPWQPQNFRLSAADGGASAVVEWDGPAQDDSQVLGREILQWMALQPAEQQGDGWDARSIAVGLGMDGSRNVVREINSTLRNMLGSKLARAGAGVKGDAYRYAARV